MTGIDWNKEGSRVGEEEAAVTGGGGEAAPTTSIKTLTVAKVEEEDGRPHLGAAEIECRATTPLGDGEDWSTPCMWGARDEWGVEASGRGATISIAGAAAAAVGEDQMDDFVESEDGGAVQQQQQQQQQHTLGLSATQIPSVAEDAGRMDPDPETDQLASVAMEAIEVTDTVDGSVMTNGLGSEDKEQNWKIPVLEIIISTPEGDTIETDTGCDGTVEPEPLCGDLVCEAGLAHEEHVCKILANRGAMPSAHISVEQGLEALTIAVRNGHGAIVKLLLDDGGWSLGVGDDDFLAACHNGHWDIVKRLLDAQGTEEVPSARAIALKVAVSAGDATAMTLIADRNFLNDSVGPQGQTLLFEPVELGNAPMVEALLMAGARANKADRNGRTPLLAAISKGHDEIVNILTSWAADVNCSDNLSQTPLTVATVAGNLNMVRKLLASKAVPTKAAIKSAIENNHRAITALLLNATNTDCLDPTLLHLAAEKGLNGHLKLLLEKRLPINAREYYGFGEIDLTVNTPLEIASIYNRKSTVEFLLQNGALADGRVKLQDRSLLLAASYKREDMAKLLLAAGANQNPEEYLDELRYGPLHYAAEAGCLPLVELLDMSGRPPHNGCLLFTCENEREGGLMTEKI